MNQCTSPSSIQVAPSSGARGADGFGVSAHLRMGLRLSAILMAVGLWAWLGTGVSYAQDISVTLSPNPAEVAEPVVATITVTNNTGGALATVPLTVTYDTSYVSYNSVSGSNPPSAGLTDGGVITWTDITIGAGLTTGAARVVTINLTTKDAISSTNIVANSPGLSGGQGSLTINQPPGKYQITGYIWHDINNSGTDSRDTSNPNEPLIPGVVVELYRDNESAGSPGVWDAGDAFITTTVAANGMYTFTNVVGDGVIDFVVRLAPSNFAPGGPLDGYIVSDSLTDPTTNSQSVPNLNTNVTGVNFGLYCRFDLALVKQISDPASGIIAPGDDITFTMTITNQGVVTASNIVVVDYLPSGFTLSPTSSGWISGANMVTTTVTGPLGGGQSTTVDIVLTAGASASGMYTNTAEIAAADSTAKDGDGNNLPDADSTPDNQNGNTQGEIAPALEDDQTNEDGLNVGGQDEDDHDIAPLMVAVFDLALRKSNSAPAWITPGADVTFTLTISNQGNVDAANIQVVDYLPAGFMLSNADANGWTGSTGTVTNMLPGTLAAGASTTVDIVLTAPANLSGVYTNTAEIAAATDTGGAPQTDIDSTPDNQNGNTPGETPPALEDDQMGEDGKNAPGDDEDDHDVGAVTIMVFDLALQKSNGAPSNIAPNDDVTFTLTISNQGTISATNITVVDYLPVDFTLNAASAGTWTDNGGGVVTATIFGPLAGGASTTLNIVLTASSTATGTYTNTAEIALVDSVLKDPTGANIPDIDSTPDNQNGNTPGETAPDLEDNQLNEDGLNVPGDDEDDHDPGLVFVTPNPVNPMVQVTKVRNGVNPFGLGETISFTIRITNTGDVTITVLPLEDNYNNAFFAYDGITNPPTPAPDSATPGVLIWNDLLASLGDTDGLGIGESIALNVYFVARADTSLLPATSPCLRPGEAPNVVHVINAIADLDGPGAIPALVVPEDADDHACDSAQIFNPTAVKLAEHSATQQADGVMVRWATVSESDIVGFNLLLSNGVKVTQLTDSMIVAKKAGQSSGAGYEWLHAAAQLSSGDAYLLELVNADGTSETAIIDVMSGISLYLPLVER